MRLPPPLSPETSLVLTRSDLGDDAQDSAVEIFVFLMDPHCGSSVGLVSSCSFLRELSLLGC